MAEDYIKREEYSRGQARLHSRVDEIAQSVTRQEEVGKGIKESVDKIFIAFYGNGRDGVIAKLGNLCASVKLHFRLIVICLGGIGGIAMTAFFVVRSFVK